MPLCAEIPMTEAVIEVRDLVFKRGQRFIFNHINLTIQQGEIVAIMGPSGTGKTTLLKLISGQLKPLSGQIRVLGEDINRLSRHELLRFRRRMSMLFQSGALFTDMTVGENVAFPIRETTQLPPHLIDILVKLKLERVGLRGAMHLMPAELSGGMARRVALARSIAMDPEMMMYDEPFTGQDPISLGMISQVIRALNDGLKMTSLIVSHDVREVCAMSDRVLLLAEGIIQGFDTPEHLQASDSDWVRQFMNAESEGAVPFHYPAPNYVDDLLQGAS